MSNATESLHHWLAAGGHTFGQLLLQPTSTGWALRHQADSGKTQLAMHRGSEQARELAQYTDAREFRPLKTAPNLQRGWELHLESIEELRRALEYFYPAMLGIALSQASGNLAAISLRATLARQTGMYRVTHKLTDEQAQAMIGDFCRTDGGCLKHILWEISPGQTVTSLPPEKLSPAPVAGEWPLLCHEACNLLVAKAREVVKKADLPAA